MRHFEDKGTVSIRPKGLDFAKAALALANAKGSYFEAVADAELTLGATAQPTLILKAAVAVGTTFDASYASLLAPYRVAASDFIEVLRPLTVLGRLSGVRRLPPLTKVARGAVGSGFGWVGEGSPIAVSSMSLDTVQLELFKLAAIVVQSAELSAYSRPGSDALIRADMLAAMVTAIDTAMFDPSVAGQAGVQPQSLTNGATTIVSSGNTALQIAADLRALFDALADADINFIAPYLVCSPRTAIGLSFKTDTAGAPAFPGVGVNGGVLAGVPLIVSHAVTNTGDSPLGTMIVLLDAAELLVAEDPGATAIDASESTSVQMSTTPDSPPTASTTFISLWQSNHIGLRVIRYINFKMRRPGAVAVLSGVNY